MAPESLFIIPLIWTCSMSCLIILLLCSLLYQFVTQSLRAVHTPSRSVSRISRSQNNQAMSNIPACHKLLSIFAVSGCLAYSVVNSIEIYYTYTYGRSESHYERLYPKIFHSLLCVFLITAKLSTYSLFLLRLHLAFRDSIYRIKLKLYILLIMLASIVVLLFLILIVAVWTINQQNETQYFKYMSYVEGSLLVTEAFINIFIMYLFNSILYRVVHSSMQLAHRQSVDYSRRSASVSQTQTMLSLIDEGPQRELVIFMVKISILCTITTVSWILRDAIW
eukprot:CAMPEP_0197075382 /NCGR_PEP_ID=MMETSP1384-20130603/211583_1 /TAXON_ID=29189 /ORGANISM="Ammonia sp." /LENGTH=278 /DNA_ID=CAMNT_0042514227 /DNA_START=13 /DNA_END=846 /DNA_ORIENTATION=+